MSVVEEEFDMVLGEMAKYEGKAIASTSVDPISWMSEEMTRKLDCKIVLKNQRKIPILFYFSVIYQLTFQKFCSFFSLIFGSGCVSLLDSMTFFLHCLAHFFIFKVRWLALREDILVYFDICKYHSQCQEKKFELTKV